MGREMQHLKSQDVYGLMPRTGGMRTLQLVWGVSLHGPMVVKSREYSSRQKSRSKHVGIQYHYTRNLVKQEKSQLNYAPMKNMLADVLTKSLPRAQHELLSKGIRLF